MERLRTDLFGSTDGSGLTRLTTEEQICLDKDRKKPANQDIDSCNKVRTVTRPLPWSVLIHASNSTAALDGTEQLASADYSIFQSLYGLQYDFSRDWAAGAAFGYGRTMLYDYAYSSVSIDSDTYSGVFWGIYTPSDLWKFSGLVGYSNFDYSSRRRILFGAIDRTARGDWGVNGFTGALDAEYDWILNPSSELPSFDKPDPNRNATRLKPRAFLSYASAAQDSFTESGAKSLDLAVHSHTAYSVVAGLGLTLETPIQLNQRNRLIPRLAVGWEHDFNGNADEEHQSSASFAQVPVLGSLDVLGQNRGSDDLDVGVSFKFESGENISIYGTVAGSFWSNGREINYGGGLRMSW